MGAADNLVSHASQNGPAQPLTSVGRHRDQVTPDRIGFLQNPMSRLSTYEDGCRDL